MLCFNDHENIFLMVHILMILKISENYFNIHACNSYKLLL